MGYFDDNEDRIAYGRKFAETLVNHPVIREQAGAGPVQCKHCGSTDVRWRQQGGAWVLFSLAPGVVHECAADDLAKDFD